VGAGVGAGVGEGVGEGVGAGVGDGVGAGVGAGVGVGDAGLLVGIWVGGAVGEAVGDTVGEAEEGVGLGKGVGVHTDLRERLTFINVGLAVILQLPPTTEASKASWVGAHVATKSLILKVNFFREVRSTRYHFSTEPFTFGTPRLLGRVRADV